MIRPHGRQRPLASGARRSRHLVQRRARRDDLGETGDAEHVRADLRVEVARSLDGRAGGGHQLGRTSA